MTTIDPLLSQRWHQARRVVLVVTLVLLAGVVLGVIASQERRGYLDPQGVDPAGARAVVQLLESNGVEVDEVRTVDDAVAAGQPEATMLVTVPDLIQPENVQRLVGSGADLVLVAPGNITEFDDSIEVAGSALPEDLEPQCDLPEAERAGSVRLGGVGYTAPAQATTCYRDGGLTFLVVDDSGPARLTVLGIGDPLTNEHLDADGNASLALGLLGHNERVVWFRPVIDPATAGQQATFGELLPDWVAPVGWQLGIAALLAAWWRARRLGPVVTEPLPVVVRAAEATEGRARLYRRGRARGHAASALRAAVVSRLRSRLGLPRDAGPPAVVEVISRRVDRPAAEIGATLGGPAPPDDAALVDLADSLDRLEQEVRTP
jgi:Domain of unknown function (DUF4350)